MACSDRDTLWNCHPAEDRIQCKNLSVREASTGTPTHVMTAAVTTTDPIFVYAATVESVPEYTPAPPGPIESTKRGYAVAWPMGASVNPYDWI
jgi:hypothetical protein